MSRFACYTGFQSREIGVYPTRDQAESSRTKGRVIEIRPEELKHLKVGPDGTTRPIDHQWWEKIRPRLEEERVGDLRG